MGHWNYRVIKKRNVGENLHPDEEYSFGVYEVYYDDNKNITACSVDPMDPYGANFEELAECLKLMGEALFMPVLVYDVDIPLPAATSTILADEMIGDIDAQDGC